MFRHSDDSIAQHQNPKLGIPRMNYWLDLFTGTTWREFLEAGANISGFRENQQKIARCVLPGDVLVCYRINDFV